MKHGKNTLKTGLVHEVTAKAVRVWSKKSSKEVSIYAEERLFSVMLKSVTVE